MNLSLYKQLSQSIIDILNTLQITFDGGPTLGQQEFFYLLIDYNASDKIADRIDKIENKYNLMDIIEFIYTEQKPLEKLLGKELFESLVSKKGRDFQEYSFGNRNSLSPQEYQKIFENQKQAFHHLCQKYFIADSKNSDAYALFIRLLKLCIYFLSGFSFIESTPVQSKKTLNIEGAIKRFSTCVRKHKKIVVSGIHGTGKTTLLKTFLNKHQLDFLYFTYAGSLEETLNQETSDQGTSKPETFPGCKDFQDKLTLLKRKGSLSFLIIDNMNPEKHIFLKESEILSSLKMHVIIATTHAVCPPDFYRYSAPLLTDNELLSMISNKLSNQYINENLLHFTGKNPYLLLLAVTADSKKEGDINDLLEESIDPAKKISLAHFKYSYHSSNTDFWGHARKIYDLNKSKKDYQSHRKHLKILSCFFDHAVSIDFFKYIFSGYDNNTLLELVNMGYLEFVKDTKMKIQLSAALANVIFINEKPSYSDPLLSPVIDKITNYLESYDVTLDLALLEDILYPFAVRLGTTISQKNNPNQKNVSYNQEKWWSFLYLVIEYYQMLNKPDIVSSLIQLLVYPTGIQYQKSPYDASILKIFNSWITGESTFISNIDSICTTISNLTKFPPSEAPKLFSMVRYLACNSLDFLICQELYKLPIADDENRFQNKNDELFITNLKFIYNLIDNTDNPSISICCYYYKIALLLFKDTYLENWEFLAEHLGTINGHRKKSQVLCHLCVFIHVCLKKILNDFSDQHFKVLMDALAKLKDELDSVCMLPGLLGQMCLATCTDCRIFMQTCHYNPATDLLDKILASIKEKYSTIRPEEWAAFNKTLKNLS